MCCGRAVAVGKALADKHPKLQQLKMGRPVQKKVALELFHKANILPGPCGLREISKFQGSLPGYQIIVIDFHERNASIYEDPRGDKKIVLYKNGDHFNVVNPAKLPAFHGKRFFCQKCKSFFKDYIANTRVSIHVTLACVRNVVWFLIKNVLVRTVLNFVVRLGVLSITRSLAN